jgi:hypothetical protein
MCFFFMVKVLAAEVCVRVFPALANVGVIHGSYRWRLPLWSSSGDFFKRAWSHGSWP